MLNDLDDQKLCINQIKRHTHTQSIQIIWNRTNGFCDTISQYTHEIRTAENSLWCDWTENIKSDREFYREIGFYLECQFVEMCVQCFLLITKWTMQALIQHVYSFHLLHSISVVVVVCVYVRVDTHNQHIPKHTHTLTTSNKTTNTRALNKTIVQNKCG